MTDPTILYITSQIPYPLDWGSAIRQFHLLSAYSRVGKVKLVFFYRSPQELDAVEALKPYCAAFHPVPFSGAPGGSGFDRLPKWRQRLDQATTLRPSMASFCFSREMRNVVEEHAPSCDLTHVSRLHMVPHVERLLSRRNGQRFILDLDDIATVFKKRKIQTDQTIRGRGKLAECVDLLRLWRYQKRALRLFDRVLVCSENDQAYLGPDRDKICVVSNGANRMATTLPDESDGRTLLFVGMLSYWPNVDALVYFLSNIFPLIQTQVAGARLLVVGKNPPAEVTRLHDGRTVIVEGNVPSVEDYYRRATVAVVPLRVGAGTRLRILESFAMGRAVVSTSIGCEGLRVSNGKHLCIADDAATFASSCVELLMNRPLRDRLTAQARQLVEEGYTWPSIERRVESLTRELLNGRRGAS